MKVKRICCAFLAALCLGAFFDTEIHPKNLSEEEQLIVVGTGALKDGFYDVAEKQFSHFVRDFANHGRIFEIYYLLGRTLYREGKMKEARGSFLKVVNESKNFEELDHALFWLAEIERKLGNVEEARRFLLTIVKRYPKFEWIGHVYYLLGLLEIASNRLDGAESFFSKSSQLSKDQEVIQSSLFWLGILSFKKNLFEAAVGYLGRVWATPQGAPPEYLKYALFWLGEANLQLARFEQAGVHFRTFCDQFKSDPLAADAYWRLGFCAFRLGQMRDAIEIFQSFKNQFKESYLVFYTHYLLGEILLLQGDYLSSVKELSALSGKPEASRLWGVASLTLFWDYIHLGERDMANKVTQRLQKMDRLEEEKIFVQWLSAEMNFYEGKVSDALPYYFNIVNSGFRERALFQIGKGYFFDTKYREAITNFDILSLEFPSSGCLEEALFMKGECLTQLGNPDLAMEAYQRVIRQKKGDHWQLFSLTQLGSIYAAQQARDKAEEAFKKVVDGFPNHPLCYHAALQLGKLYFKDRNVVDAIFYYSMVPKGNILELLGETYFGLGEIFYQEGNHDKAYLSFEKAVRHLSEGSLWFFLAQLEIGNLQRQWGKYSEAKKSYRIILDRSKDEEIRKVAKELLNDIDSR